MLLAYRELDDTLRLTDTGPDTLADVRTARTVAIGWRAFCANRCSAHLPGQWIDKVHRQRPPKVIVLVMDSSESRTYGDREIRTLRLVARSGLRILDPIWTTAYVSRNHGYIVFDTLERAPYADVMRMIVLPDLILAASRVAEHVAINPGAIDKTASPAADVYNRRIVLRLQSIVRNLDVIGLRQVRTCG